MCEVSVVIPAFNSQTFIREAIVSAMEQTITPLEIIVVDDGSSDETYKIVRSFKDIKLIKQPNQGSGSARNNGIFQARGKWVAFLDSDDKWKEDHIESLMLVLSSNHDAALSYSGKIWTDPNGEVIQSATVQNEYPSGWVFRKLLENNYISSTSCVVVRRDVLLQCGGFRTDPVFRNGEDYELWLRICATHPIVSSCRKSVFYRRHGNNQTLKKSNYALGHLEAVRSGCNLVRNGNVDPANEPHRIDIIDRLRRAYREAITATFHFGDYKASRLIFRKMLKDRIVDFAVISRGLLCLAPGSMVDKLRGLRRNLAENGKDSVAG